MHVDTQRLALHATPVAPVPTTQARPQLPQLFASELVSTHAPPHNVRPAGQRATHMPVTHAAVPPDGATHATHAMPHAVTSVSDAQIPPHR